MVSPASLFSGCLNLCLFNHWGVYFSINKNLRFSENRYTYVTGKYILCKALFCWMSIFSLKFISRCLLHFLHSLLHSVLATVVRDYLPLFTFTLHPTGWVKKWITCIRCCSAFKCRGNTAYELVTLSIKVIAILVHLLLH